MKHYTNVSVSNGRIYHKYYTETGRQEAKELFEPHFYQSSKDGVMKTIKGKPVKRVDFPKISDARKYLNDYHDDHIIHGNTDFPTMFIHENYMDDIEYDMANIRTWFVDIECYYPEGFPDPADALGEINAVTIYDTKDDMYHILHTLNLKNPTPNTKNRNYVACGDEPTLLKTLIQYFNRYNPDILSGWNSAKFDIPYIINRTNLVLGDKEANKLSPIGSVRVREITGTFGKPDITANIDGIECIDYLDLYKKFIFEPRESYRLGFIAQTELGETKLEYKGSIADFSKDDPDRFLEYNVKDVELLAKLERKLKLFNLCVSVGYMMKCNFSDVLGTVKPWSSRLHFELEKEGIIIDNYSPPEGTQSYEAAYVKEPIAGMYKSIVTIDATSMYPHMLMGFNISPEKKVEYQDVPDELRPYYLKRNVEQVENGEFDISELLKKHQMCICGNGQMFRVDSEGIIPRIIKGIFNQRKVVKREMLDLEKEMEADQTKNTKENQEKVNNLNTQQLAIKIILNSLYGSLGNKYFPLFDLKSAEAITLSGQAGIRYVNKEVSKWVSKITGIDRDYVVYTDTDSSHIIMDDILEKFGISPTNIDIIQKIADEKVQEVVTGITEDYARIMNMLWASLIFKREKICGCNILPSGESGNSSCLYCMLPDVKLNSINKTIEEAFNQYESKSNSYKVGNDDVIDVDINCLSYNEALKDFESDTITSLIRRRYSGNVISFELENGEILKVTEDHDILVNRTDGILWVKAKDVLDTDDLIDLNV